jgi:F-type H+-transporting ATPase subunit b
MHFDWSTLILQTVNVLVSLWLLRCFLFRPIIAIIAERRDAAEKLLADAAVAREQSRAQAEQTAQHEKALAAESAHIMADARTAAATERDEVLEQANQEASAIRNAAQADLEQQRDQIRRDLDVAARHLAVTIASRLLSRVPPQAVSAALLASLNALSAQEWQALAEPGESLEVVTAAPLDAPTQAACTEMVRKRLACPIQFGTDLSLIAGVELRGPHAKLHNNWRADLDRIAEELSHDDKRLVVA